MIFFTVGTQLPFDRATDYLLRWQDENNYRNIIYQVGKSTKFQKEDGFHISINEPSFSNFFDEADFIVSHAGMGNIIRALDLNKAIVVVPRESSLGEHVNDHQLDTIDSLSGLPNLFSARNYQEFNEAMFVASCYKADSEKENGNLSNLIGAVSEFVAQT